MNTQVARPDGGGSRGESTDRGLTHLDEHGRARMVDVTAKPLTNRVAVARCVVCTVADTAVVLAVGADGMDVVEAARVAGIQAAKQTSSLIPLCHPIRIDRVTVEVVVHAHRCEVSATAQIVERTGVEMEALTACAFAALTLVTAFAEVDPETSIEDLTLWHKSGGRSGDWHRDGPDEQLTRHPGGSANPDPGA